MHYFSENFMSDSRLIEALAVRVMNWKVAPDRFLKGGRGWMPRWRFAPLERLEDAFVLLSRGADEFTLTSRDGIFTAEVHAGGRKGSASGEPKARTISLALARAVGIETPHGHGEHR
jgi:hypothetical protein